jgi:hypothetical protein
MYTISMGSDGRVFGDRLGFCFYYFVFLTVCAFAQQNAR